MQLNKTSGGAIAALAGTLLCGTTHLAKADTVADRAAVNSRYYVYSQAIKAHDIAACVGMETPDYTHVLANGKVMNRKDADSEFAAQTRAAASIDSFVTKIQQFTSKGNQATVVVRQSIKATLLDAKGGKHGVSGATTTRETWIKNSRGWFLQKSVDQSGH